MFETLFGGLLGGLFRMAPEVLKWLDRKDERKHELDMLSKEMDFAKIRAEQQMHTVDAQVDVSQFDAIGKALEGQTVMATAAGKLVSGISALVRPLVTYWVVCLWSGVKIASMVLVYQTGGSWKEMLISNWGSEDGAILSMILAFWFVGRSIEKKSK
ncbi:MAG: hypothetical protein JZU60_02630 [Ilumatobacteraceae bacterium]|nr:hypothetical protein [Ilumatobacteraceae bacterium]